MKTFAASVAVWGALALAGLYLGAPHRLLYWSGVALVLFWILVRHRLAVPPVRGPPPAAALAHLPPPNRAQSTTRDQDREDEDEERSERHEAVRRWRP